MASYLRIANLRKVYKLGDGSVQKVLNGITLDFEKGELVSLLGESGSGKSTLLNIIGGLDDDFTGSVAFKGSYMSDYTEKQMDYYRKKNIGFIFQNYNLIAHMTLLQNIEIAMTINGVDDKRRNDRARELLKMVGLEDERNKLPSQLSGGQKQRVAIARALANNPSMIIADEPTGALDKESAEVVFEILREIANLGKLVIIVTHSEQIASKCSRTVKIEGGVIIEDKENYKIDSPEKNYEQFENKALSSRDTLKIAFGNILRNRSRNIVIAFGVAISIVSMILILNLSQGLQSYVTSIYDTDPFSKQIEIYKDNFNTNWYSDLSDIEEIDGVDEVIGVRTFTTFTTTDSNSTSLDINYITTYTDNAPYIEFGDYPTTGEIMINVDLANSLVTNSIYEVIGEYITIKNTTLASSTKYETLRISGVYDSDSGKTSAYVNAVDLDSFTAVSSSTYTTRAYVIADEIAMVSSIMEDLKDMGFNTFQSDSEAQTIIDYINLGSSVLTGVSAASMVVGAIMIFIVFYICVVERTKEIGILKAIGCEKKDIRKMFSYEASLLGLISGVLGCLICLILSIVANVGTYFTLEITLIAFNPIYYLIGILTSVVISTISGISPALNASQLDPISSLRYE
ncbi:MAG: ATP-binding cassette domain-containing protein [bacterium]